MARAVGKHCTGCKRAREREGKPPRVLTQLHPEVTQFVRFQRKAKPVFLCSFCDGPALERAQKETASRTKKSSP